MTLYAPLPEILLRVTARGLRASKSTPKDGPNGGPNGLGPTISSKLIIPPRMPRWTIYGIECPCGMFLPREGEEFCDLCKTGGSVPREVLEKLPPDARKIFEPPTISQLCVPCYRGQNIVYSVGGTLTKAICGPCRHQVAHSLDIYKCGGIGRKRDCGNPRFIHPHGTVAKYCKVCAKAGRERGRQWVPVPPENTGEIEETQLTCREGSEVEMNPAEDFAPPEPKKISDVQAGGAAFTISPFPLKPIQGLELPAKFDKWRQEGYLLPPLDQAKCGACYVFAAVAQLADRISIATNKRVQQDLSTQFVLSCLQSRYEYGCGGTLDVPPIYAALLPGGFLGGTYRQWVFPFSGRQSDPKPDADPQSQCFYTPNASECRSRKFGDMSLPPNCYPPLPKTGMNCTGTVPCDLAYISRWYPGEKKYTFAEVFHLSENTNAGVLFSKEVNVGHYRYSIPVSMTPQQLANNTRRIKEAILQYGPVTAIIPIYSDLGKKINVNTPAWGSPDYVYEVDDDAVITGLHHVLVVGWGSDAKGQYWVVKNSWGVWWNYSGYFNARLGDPKLLVESSCHSGVPFNPETGRIARPQTVGSAGHTLGGVLANLDLAKHVPHEGALFLVLFVILVVVIALVAARHKNPATPGAVSPGAESPGAAS